MRYLNSSVSNLSLVSSLMLIDSLVLINIDSNLFLYLGLESATNPDIFSITPNIFSYILAINVAEPGILLGFRSKEYL